jgi:hypothetical protein
MTPADLAVAERFVDEVNAKSGGHNWRRRVHSGDVRRSQIRAKLGEIFFGQLFDVPIDLAIYQGHDGGVDTIFKGFYFGIKRYGTLKATRGKARFVQEETDRFALNPHWDFGVVVEDDHQDDWIYRLVGYTSRARWMLGRKWEDEVHPCWYVDQLQDPLKLLTTLAPRNPPRPWPPLDDLQVATLDVLVTVGAAMHRDRLASILYYGRKIDFGKRLPNVLHLLTDWGLIHSAPRSRYEATPKGVEVVVNQFRAARNS